MKSNKKWMGVALAAVALVTVSANLFPRSANGDEKKLKASASSYRDDWRKLFEDHITWTRIVILGVLKDLPGTGTYTTRLLQNYEDMEAALKPYYGDSAEVLGDLIKDHLVIAAEILQDAKAGDTADMNDAVARWYVNGHDIAVQMAKMNPLHWQLSMADAMWKEHLDATLAEAVAVLTNDFAGDVAAYDKVHLLALDMADFFSNGVTQQFPGSFTGSKK